MRYWALELYSYVQRIISLFFAVASIIGFIGVLMTINVVEQALARQGIRFADGAIGVVFFSTCGLIMALITALDIYALGQLLQLMISLEENLRGLRSDLRQRRRPGEGEGLAPVAPAEYTPPDERRLGVRRRGTVEEDLQQLARENRMRRERGG